MVEAAGCIFYYDYNGVVSKTIEMDTHFSIEPYKKDKLRCSESYVRVSLKCHLL